MKASHTTEKIHTIAQDKLLACHRVCDVLDGDPRNRWQWKDHRGLSGERPSKGCYLPK